MRSLTAHVVGSATIVLGLTMLTGCPSPEFAPAATSVEKVNAIDPAATQNDMPAVAAVSSALSSSTGTTPTSSVFGDAGFPDLNALLASMMNGVFPGGTTGASVPANDAPATPAPSDSTPPAPSVQPMSLSSAAFVNNATIPARYTADGGDVSPPLNWSNAPANTQELVVIVEDTDVNFIHWLLYGIPAATTSLGENAVPVGARHGMNDFGSIGYGGPNPPAGPVHHYRFTVYALDTKVTLGAGASRNNLVNAMANHVLATAELTGTYGH